jgi:type IV pilus assembly protein PilB
MPKPATPPEPAAITPRVEEENTTVKWALSVGYPYLNSREITKADIAILYDTLPLDVLRKFQVAPVHKYSAESFELGLTPQTNRAQLPELQKLYPAIQLTFKAISQSGLEYILNSLYIQSFDRELGGDFQQFYFRLKAQQPKAAFALIAQLAYLMRASDIHIEPREKEARIRFRIDGVLHPITTVDNEAYKIFLADLQTSAQIKWGSDQPQSGRISFLLITVDATRLNIDMRIETIPSFHGEEIVVRMFSTEPQYLRLENLGFSPQQLGVIEQQASRQLGMILTVGPTGSGKTSTLYAIVNRLNSPEVKIVTLEDPVEYDLPGISQVPIESSDHEMFAEALRAVMREDPNVIMIGEIRDIDTARTAMQASLTGHLVLSTFHASSAATAITRLMDMIGDNPLLPSALHLIQAQRLVRHICPHCIETYKPTSAELEKIKDVLKDLPQKLHPDYPKLKLHRGKGCTFCHGIGYLGRVGIVEQLLISTEIQALISQTETTTAQAIEELAISQGLVTLLQDAMLKVLDGQTTLEEISTISDI